MAAFGYLVDAANVRVPSWAMARVESAPSAASPVGIDTRAFQVRSEASDDLAVFANAFLEGRLSGGLSHGTGDTKCREGEKCCGEELHVDKVVDRSVERLEVLIEVSL